MSLLLLLLYPLAIQYERGGWWRLLLPVTVVTFIIDVVANYTELALIFGFPLHGEFTLSKRLKRLTRLVGWRGSLASLCIKYANYFDPQGDHIK